MSQVKTNVEGVEGINGTKFKSIMLVSIYRYAKMGMTEEAIWGAIGVADKTWKAWKKKFPSINQAVRMGRTETDDGGTWHKFIYDRLAPDLRALWDKINEWDDLPNGMAKIEALLNDHGKAVRQQLYLHALIYTNFSPSRSMAKVCISRSTLDEWINNDPNFADLVEQIQWHKDNFFEEKFIQLVAAGSESATIHAVRSRLRDRGYGVKSEIDHNHTGTVDHHHIDLTELELSSDVRVVLLNAIRQREEKIAAEKAKASMPYQDRLLVDLSEEIASPV